MANLMVCPRSVARACDTFYTFGVEFSFATQGSELLQFDNRSEQLLPSRPGCVPDQHLSPESGNAPFAAQYACTGFNSRKVEPSI